MRMDTGLTLTLTTAPGAYLPDVCKAACHAATVLRIGVEFTFNGTVLTASPDMLWPDLSGMFWKLREGNGQKPNLDNEEWAR